MRTVVIAMFALSIGISAANAQQQQANTCSARAAACNRICETSYANRVNQCRGTCSNKLGACMQTGIWHIDNGPDVPVQRQ